jgi:hypothetical protein
MSHAIYIKPKVMPTFLSIKSLSFEFVVDYKPALLVNSFASKTKFEWTDDDNSLIENTKGSLGKSKPKVLYLTKALHLYSGFNHSHEMIVEHVYPDSTTKIFFVFFIQYKHDGTHSTELDDFLEKKKNLFSLNTFIGDSWKNRNNSYYQTITDEHVFVFPSIIGVGSSKLYNLTTTTQNSSTIYKSIFQSNILTDFSLMHINNNTKHLIVNAQSHDIVITEVIGNQENFEAIDNVASGNSESSVYDCIPIDDNGDDIDGTNSAPNIDDNIVNRLLPHMILMSLLGVGIAITTAWLSTKAMSDKNFYLGLVIFMGCLMGLIVILTYLIIMKSVYTKSSIQNIFVAYFSYFWLIMQCTIYIGIRYNNETTIDNSDLIRTIFSWLISFQLSVDVN